VRYAAVFRDERTFVAAMERSDPDNSVVQAEKARLLLNDGRRGPALAALRRAVELDPTAAGSMTWLAELELEDGNFAAAEALYRRALVIVPSDSKGLKRVALALARQGQRQRAYAVAAEAARRWPEDFESQLLQALFLQAAGKPRQAEAAFERARRLRSGDPAVAGGLDALAARLLPGMFPGG
jgi:tetratricopeptide (TPR) repeat protein